MRAILSLLTLFIVASAFARAFADDDLPGLEIEEIQKDIYLHRSFSRADGFGLVSSNGLVVVDNGKAFIVDTPWSEQDTKKLVEWIKEHGYQLSGSISTHSHEDRTAGIQWLNSQSVPTYASALTNEILKRDGKELASTTIEESDYILADGLIEVFYPGGGHTIDNVVVWVPKSKTLFGGCFVRSLGSSSLGYTGEAQIEKWPGSVAQVITKYPGAKLVIPGHGQAGDVQLLNHTMKLARSASN